MDFARIVDKSRLLACTPSSYTTVSSCPENALLKGIVNLMFLVVRSNRFESDVQSTNVFYRPGICENILFLVFKQLSLSWEKVL